jgi:hypothetical protein
MWESAAWLRTNQGKLWTTKEVMCKEHKPAFSYLRTHPHHGPRTDLLLRSSNNVKIYLLA